MKSVHCMYMLVQLRYIFSVSCWSCLITCNDDRSTTCVVMCGFRTFLHWICITTLQTYYTCTYSCQERNGNSHYNKKAGVNMHKCINFAKRTLIPMVVARRHKWYSCMRGSQLLDTFLANVNSCSCSLYVVVRPSVVCRLSVCNVRAPYSADWNFRQCFCAI